MRSWCSLPPRGTPRSGMPRYLPSVVTIKRRSDATATRRQHVTWPLLNTPRMLILVGRPQNYRSRSTSSGSWGEQNQLLLLLLCKRTTFCDEGGFVHLVPRLRTRAEPTKSSKAGHIVPDKLKAHQPTHLYGAIWDPWRSLVDKRPVLELTSIWWWASCEKRTAPAKRQHTRARIYCGLLS